MSTTRVHRILETSGPLALPGIFDTLSARIAELAGFPLAFVSGYSVAATAIGEPDLGLLTQTEMIDRARRICMSTSVPVLIDADTGYGNALNVHRTVRELIAAGAAGCFLEDQVWPKRCGHMRGKRLVAREFYFQNIRAAVDAREGHDFFIVARTDALAGLGMDEAIARVEGARAAGADASFVEAPASLADLEEIGRRSPAPNVANMIQGGRTPLLTREELGRLGFHLILHPLAGLFAAAGAMESAFARLRATGSCEPTEPQPMTFPRFNQIIGVEERLTLAARYDDAE